MAKWLTVWAQAHTDMSILNKKKKNCTVRMTVRASVDGSKLRIRMSNRDGKGTAEVLSTTIMKNQDAPVPLLFNKKKNISLKVGESCFSDELSIDVKKEDVITISIAYAGIAASGNNLPVFTRYSKSGDYTNSADMPRIKRGMGEKLNELDSVLPILSSIDIFTEDEKRVLVCFGDSITQMSRWTEPLKNRLQYENRNMLVINEGISGNQLMSDPPVKFFNIYGIPAIKRFKEDAMDVEGITDLIIALGVNDLNMIKDEKELKIKNAQYLFDGLRKLASQAEDRGINVYVTTVTPLAGCAGYRPFIETERVSLNKLIRESTEFYGILDYDRVLRDPSKPDHMYEVYDSGDHLHPNFIGGQLMSELAYDVISEKLGGR